MLVILGLWRHVSQRFPLHYDPLYWGAVFPLGMYTVCSLRLSQALDIPWLLTLAGRFVFVALLAWLIVAAQWIGTLARPK
jgi:tellurite resistance protein TehA-like permease